MATDEPNEHERRWAGMWFMAQSRFEAVSLGVWHLITRVHPAFYIPFHHEVAEGELFTRGAF